MRLTLLYANVTEADILLREELAALDKPPPAGWSGASGYISKELIRAHVPPAERGDKVKVFLCGALLSSLFPARVVNKH